ncbi:hypothetical protein BDV93DRAFT_470880 [Ceratobasidium sp. AG-I]|nr:hypothetical protein BDV93DRAFT_470880 [Ceratobasidium sp. AG-I]
MKFSSALLSSVAICLFSSVVTAARNVPINGALEARQNNRNGNNNGGGGGGNPQTSLTLDSSVINSNFAKTGQEGATEAGQVASLTSKNNYINFCIGKTLTNGQQVKGGSCNSAPMGDIPASTKQPSAKFVSPANLENIAANKAFTVKLAVKNMATGNFVNPQSNYYSAPQQLNGQGVIVAHSHITIQQISSLTDTAVPDPTKFAFFQGLNAAAQGGVLSATVTGGLPAGVYRISSINTNANHAPVVGPVAQRGAFDDAIYVTVGGAGGGNGGNGGNTGGTKTTSTAPAATTSARNGGGKGNGGGKNGGGKKLARRFPSRDGKARL